MGNDAHNKVPVEDGSDPNSIAPIPFPPLNCLVFIICDSFYYPKEEFKAKNGGS